MHFDNGITATARVSASDSAPWSSGSIARPMAAQNSICPAIDRFVSSLIMRASWIRLSDNFTG
jgi:hypothetical protein